MTPLSNMKLVLGFTDVVESDSFEYHDESQASYVMRMGEQEKATVEWQLYHTSFVGAWLDLWGETISKPHCCVVMTRPYNYDLNFVDLTREDDHEFSAYINPTHFSEFEYIEKKYQLVYPWYASFQHLTSDVSHYNSMAQVDADLVPYKPLPIEPCVNVMSEWMQEPTVDNAIISRGYPNGFKKTNIQIGTLIKTEAEAEEVFSKYNRVCRISIMPIDGWNKQKPA